MALVLTTSGAIVKMAGEGASSTITASAAWVIFLGERAEKELCTDSGMDWIGGYASVNANIKGLLDRGAAAKAAKDIVHYSAKGYTTRLEQETIIDILTDDYNKIVAKLQKIDPSSIRSVGE